MSLLSAANAGGLSQQPLPRFLVRGGVRPSPSRQEGDLLLGGKLGLVVRPRAYLCRSCKTVITQYQ